MSLSSIYTVTLTARTAGILSIAAPLRLSAPSLVGRSFSSTSSLAYRRSVAAWKPRSCIIQAPTRTRSTYTPTTCAIYTLQSRWNAPILYQHRSFHSSPSLANSSYRKSQQLDAHFVRFKLSKKEAEAKYNAWIAQQPFAPSELNLNVVHQTDVTYLPFYVFDIDVRSRFSGRLGYNTTESYYNSSSKRWESRTVTQWRPMPHDPNYYAKSYTSDLPQMQVYGAFKHKWEPIQVVKTPLSTVPVLEPNQMQPEDFDGKEIDVFEMKTETAKNRVLEFIRQSEEARGHDMMLARYQCDTVQVEAEVQMIAYRIRRVYQPAIVFHFKHLGTDFEVIVNGVTGATKGQFIYDAAKVGTTAFLTTGAAYILASVFHVIHFSFTSFILGVLAPSIVAGFVGKYWASIRQFLREAKRIGDREDDARKARGASEYGSRQWSWQQTAGENEETARQQRYEQQYRKQQSEQEYRRAQPQPSKPKKSHYDVLGIKPSASLDDIRTAFRAKSFQYHPDVNKGKEAWANEKFREILEAYQTLRDPKKRAAYDSSR